MSLLKAVPRATIECVLLENFQNLGLDFGRHNRWLTSSKCHHVRPPATVLGGPAPQPIYDDYRRHLDSACADIVVTSYRPDGTPVALTVQRSPTKPFGGKWWMQGGAIHTYRSVVDFIQERAHVECGVRPRVCGVIGMYRTCAEDGICSTLNVCFLGFIPWKRLDRAIHDGDHTAARIVSLKEWDALPKNERHWYPDRTIRIALTILAMHKKERR